MEQFSRRTVAPSTAVALRGGERLAPVWWEALDEEGSRRGGILQNPPPWSNRVVGVAEISIVAGPTAHGVAMPGVAWRDVMPHSSPFFTGLCEKDRAGAASLALLAEGHK